MIVRDNQQVDLRHALSVPRVIPGKGLINKRERRRIATKHRVNQNALARQLQIPRGVPQPDHRVLP